MIDLTRRIGQLLVQNQWRIGTAESCTGGLLAAAITEVAGSSAWFDEGVVTYANASKQRLLGVQKSVLEEFGAVSQQVVEAMVEGVFVNGADVALATSGIAGPDGGTADKPVGTVWMAWGVDGQIESEMRCFEGDRQAVRLAASEYLFGCLLEKLERF
ncbi:MAG: hypothetical protein CL693_00510 [Cellvibrionaceae bacterium]|nr:hypothetical protein [Cellvibrionaceae bacterium]|tara:strand:+ start:69750 stop:70223 length:474 start_codon:yes stop_codon:yes gene_type:complete